jgi:hypothetical protein
LLIEAISFRCDTSAKILSNYAQRSIKSDRQSNFAVLRRKKFQVLELSAMNTESVIDWDEMFEYLPGTVVELKNKPEVLHRIDYYEAMMVPPIWLVDDPCPRYPHELRIVSRREVQVCELEPQLSLV